MSDAISAAWQVLEGLPKPDLKALFADPARLDAWSTRLDLPGGAVRFDWSKTHLDTAHGAAFLNLAEAAGFAQRRGAMFGGEPINATEDRAVEHTALRGVGRETSVEEADMDSTIYVRLSRANSICCGSGRANKPLSASVFSSQS